MPKNRVLKSLKSNVLFQLLSAGNQILLVPIFLYFWGVEKYGVWLTIIVISSFFSLVDFGMGHYLPNQLSRLKNRNKIREYNLVLGIFASVFILVSIFFIIMGVIISTPISQNIILNSADVLIDSKVRESLIILFSLNIFQSIFNFSALIYISSNDYYKTSQRRNQIAILNVILIPVGLYFHADYAEIAAIMFINYMVIEVISLMDVFKRYKFVQLKILPLRKKIIKKYYLKSIWLAFVKVYEIGYQGIPIILIQMFLSPIIVVIFSTHRTLVNTALQLKQIIIGIVWREGTILFALNKIKEIANMYLFSQKIILYFSLIVSFAVVSYGNTIFTYWLNGEVEFDYLLMGLMLIVALAQVPWMSAETILLSKSEAKFIVIAKVGYLFLYTFLGFISLYVYDNLYYLVTSNIVLNIFVLNYPILKELHIHIGVTRDVFIARIAAPFLIMFIYAVVAIIYFQESEYILIVSYIIMIAILIFDLYRTDFHFLQKIKFKE